jgi:hypothetical protein
MKIIVFLIAAGTALVIQTARNVEVGAVGDTPVLGPSARFM